LCVEDIDSIVVPSMEDAHSIVIPTTAPPRHSHSTKAPPRHGHSDRSKPMLFPLLRSCEGVGLCRGGISLRCFRPV